MTMKLSRLLLSTALILTAFAGITFSLPSPTGAAPAWYVDGALGTDAPGNGTGPGALAFKTIQYAVDRGTVLSGSTINIAASAVYVEQVTLPVKDLTLTGPSPTTPAVIRAPGTRVADGLADYIVEAPGSSTMNVRFQNLAIDANGTTISAPGATSYYGVILNNVVGAAAGLFNCSIYGFGGSPGDPIRGVYVHNNSSLIIDTCSIRDFKSVGIYAMGNPTQYVQVHNCNIAGSSGTMDVYIGGGSALVNNNTITGGTQGVYSSYTVDLQIMSNEILNQSDYGINCQDVNGATPVTIALNKIHINAGTGAGIYTNAAASIGSIDNNEIYNCAEALELGSSATNWSITSNILHDCTNYGIYSSSQVTVCSGNAIYNCKVGILVNTNLLTAHCNAIFRNATAGLTLSQNGTYDVRNNYWGSNSGPNINSAGPGTGDKIITNAHTGLLYNPWSVISLTTSPATLVAGSGASTITMDVTKNSTGASTGCIIPAFVNAVFTTSFGSFGGSATVTKSLASGIASADLSSDTAGIATVTGSIANAPLIPALTAQVVFTAPINPLIGAGAPTSHGSSVSAPTTPAPPMSIPIIQIQSASLSAKAVTPGTPITVTADIANKSAVNGNKKVTLYVNGQVETTQGVTVNSGDSSKLNFSVSRSEPGDYSVYVDGVPAGSFKVELFRESDGILIFSAVLVALAFIIGVVMLWRRQHAA